MSITIDRIIFNGKLRGIVNEDDVSKMFEFALTLDTPDDCQAYRADVPTGTPPWCIPPC